MASNSNANAEFAAALDAFWRSDDFTPLKSAGAQVNAALRQDEQDADLYSKIGAGPSHFYFASENKSGATSATTPTNENIRGTPGGSRTGPSTSASPQKVPPPLFSLQHRKSIPLPAPLDRHLKEVKARNIMGLFAQAGIAWMTVDDTLYLWNYGNATTTEFCYLSVPSRQCVVTAGLVRPKKGIFKSSVEWCLVVTSPDEVFIYALVRSTPSAATASPQRFMDHDSSSSSSSMQLKATSFSLPTDDTRILSVAGTANGRIFLGGDDGSLHEMLYSIGDDHDGYKKVASGNVEQQLEAFYDQGKDIPETISERFDDSITDKVLKLGKRALRAFENGNSPRRKCRRVNVSSNVSTVLRAVVPDFLINTTSFLFGGKIAMNSAITQMVVDEERQCLYTLSELGWICVYDLAATSQHHIRLAAVMDGTRTTRLYLEAVSRGQMFPPSTGHSSSTIGTITFLGGGSSAQAGVGGMEGARSILKLADYRRGGGSGAAPSSDGSSILKPISIHVVSPTESSRLTLMAVTKGGLRLYLSSLAPHVLSNGPNASRYGSGSSSSHYQRSNPLSPWNRITLCHVRAPPPLLDHSIQDFSGATAADSAAGAMVEGGIIPRIQGSKVAQVDASAYNQGVHVTAVMDPAVARQSSSRAGSSTNTGLLRRVGDMIVVTCPDAMIRKKVTPSNTSSAALPVQQGGLVETMSLPMSSAYGGSLNDSPAILPGGIVWAIAPVSTKESAVMTMMTNSKTPTETELGVGLPPAYYPPSKVRARDLDQTKVLNGGAPSLYGPGASTSTGIVARSSPIRKTSLKVLRNVLTNVLLSRPLRHGLTFDELLEDDSARDFDAQPSYRISKRDCSRGFSTTAGESSPRAVSTISSPSAKTSRNTRSARLRPWLLRPATVPLSYLSTLYFDQTREMVALNTGGLHYFGHTTILSRLAEALISANENVAYDPTTTSFFSGYGYREGCCMCLALAIGCGPAAGNAAFNKQVRKRASDAALARAYVPKLVSRPAQSGTVMTDVTTTDKLVPQGYDFRASALSEGLTALFSRLVRPIWHKPAVVVTEGREVKLRYSNDTRLTPAKVEILLDEATLEEIGGFLRNLLNLMKDIFSPAVRTVPGATQQQGHMMDVDENEEDQAYLTRALQYNSHMRGGGGSSTMPLTAFEAEHIARLLEEKNIHSLYRLLARVVQLLNLMSLLRRAQGMAELREVDWGLLHGLTIAQLVQTSEGQERLESLLNSLVTSSASSRSQTAVQSAQADQLASLFADQCYLFFSPGSHFAYLGLRKANEALDQPISSSSRISLANQASQHLLQAAKHWHSAPLITGRILHTKGEETFRQIALRAMQYGSPLAKAVEVLIELENVGCAVDVCLTTADNFKSGRVINARSSEQLGGQRTYELGWEQNLYHKRHNGQDSAAGISTTQSSPSQIFAYGTEVTSRDAIDTCYALIFYHLSMLFNARSSLADNMVAACAAASDVSFLEAFFSYLLESDHADTLLRLNSASLDKWLRERKDPDLLWRFYNVQGRHKEAGQVALDRARDANCKLLLGERIEWLSRTVTSYKIASEQGQQRGRFEVGFNEIVAGKAKEANDSLRLARLQNRILTSVDSSGPDEMTLELRDKLAYTLVPVTELYNDFAAALGMFEECLLILHACHHDEAGTIEMLWRNVFCEVLLPCGTRNETTYHFLQTFVADLALGNQITFLSETEQSDSLMIFENLLWEKPLVQRVVDLGKELYGTGADYFPIEFILARMEEIQQSVPKLLSPGWALLALADAGVPFLVIMDAYESVTPQSDRVLLGVVEMDKHIERVAAFLELIEYWLSLAQSNTRTSGGLRNAAYKELSRAMASGQLSSKIDAIKRRITVLPDEASMTDRLKTIEESIRFIV